MNVEAFPVHIRRLDSLLGEISENVEYIRNELHALQIPHDEKARIGEQTEEFDSAIYDVRKEIRNLEDKLGLHPGQAPFDPEIRNPDPRVTMNFIDQWLWTEIEGLHQTVMRVDRLSKHTKAFGLAYLLLAESSVNILNAHSAIKEVLNAIGTELDRAGA